MPKQKQEREHAYLYKHCSGPTATFSITNVKQQNIEKGTVVTE